MATKACSSCLEDRLETEYSGAQLKKKGKRVCTYCINKTQPPTQKQVDTQFEHPVDPSQAEPVESLSSLAAAGPETFVPDVKPKKLAPGTYPNNPLFNDSPVAYEKGIALGRDVAFYDYSSESQLSLMTDLIDQNLSEPYSIFTYRYFVNFWPHLTFMAMIGSECIGCVMCRLVRDRQGYSRGYIAMLAVSTLYRKCHIGSRLVQLAIDGMKAANADLCVLEAEVANKGALALYEKLNFVRECRLPKYYLSGSDAFQLKLWLKPVGPPAPAREEHAAGESKTG